MSNKAQVFTYETENGNVVLPLIGQRPAVARALMALGEAENSSDKIKAKIYFELLDSIFMAIQNGTEGKRAFSTLADTDFKDFVEAWSKSSQGKSQKKEIAKAEYSEDSAEQTKKSS